MLESQSLKHFLYYPKLNESWCSMGKSWNAYWLFTGLKFKKVLQFPASLIAQAVAMILNNLGFMAAWGLLFARFGNINGYTIWEIVLIQGYVAVFYAIFFWFIGGVAKSTFDYIDRDRLLDLQLYPLNPLLLLTTKSGEATQWGDMLEGVVLLAIYMWHDPSSLLLVIICLILTIAGTYGVTLFISSISFFIPRGGEFFGDLIQNIYIGGSMYPSQNFKGIVRTVFYTLLLVPVVFYPIEAVRGILSPKYLLITLFFVILINSMGYLLWKAGIKRIDSGSGGGIVE